MRCSLLLLLAALAGLTLFLLRAPSPKEPPPAKAASVSGRVVDPSGCPLAGVRVRLQATGHTASTDARGRFVLPRLTESRRVTAWKPGYFIGGAPPGASPLELALVPLPEEDHDDYVWVDPRPDPRQPLACGNCHGTLFDEWRQSGHARSVLGRHFRDLYAGTGSGGEPGVSWGLLTQYEEGGGVCASCHAPALPDDHPAQLDLRLVDGTARQGVHCDFCHKVADVADGPLGLAHGRYQLELLRPSPADPRRQIFFGPLDDVDRGEDAFAPVYRDSRYCASCHEGVVFGIHVYSTYSEWLESPARRQGLHCQSCHMRPTGSRTLSADGPPPSLPAGQRRHFAAAQGPRREPATLGNHQFFAGSQADMLRACLDLEVDLHPAAGAVEAVARVSAGGVGHRVPTGYIDRQLLLVVEGYDAAGRPLAPTHGPLLPAPAGPPLAGAPGKLYARTLTGMAGESPAPFWRARPEAADTRLRPGQPDLLRWIFPPQLARLRARLLYRRFWQQVIQAKGWPDRDLCVHEVVRRR